MGGEKGDVTGYLGTVTDITERKQADQMKSDSVSFVTHQLRTPLAGIKWLLELASEDPEVPEETLSYLKDARESADRLIKLVNDLLDISRLERGKLKMALEEVQLVELTQRVLEGLSPLIQEKSHHCSLRRADGVPPIVVDPQLIRQVILNLISNAIKYTPKDGQIAIDIHQDGNGIRWAIRDSGIGIPREAQPRLFEKFYRAENGLTIATEGTGLGLYLVRLILEQFRGRIWCEEVLRILKQDPTTKQIPIVVLSNLGQESDVQQALQGGAVAYFIKANLSLQELVTKVQTLFSGGAIT